MIRAAILALALAVATAAEAAPSSAVIGDLVLDYDDADWHVTPRPNGIAFRPSECTAPWCGELTGVFVTIAPADGPLPSEIPRTEFGFVRSLWELMNEPPAWPGDGAIHEINGFTIFATDRWSGCRAASPSELTAILDHAGRRYTFRSGIAMGCKGVWDVGREAFVEILSGLRPRP
jgi:hypothetical protein